MSMWWSPEGYPCDPLGFALPAYTEKVHAFENVLWMEEPIMTNLELDMVFKIDDSYELDSLFDELVTAMETRNFVNLIDVDAGMDSYERVVSIAAVCQGQDFASAEQAGRAEISELMTQVMPRGGFTLVSASLAA
jgi:hypothetical protein